MIDIKDLLERPEVYEQNNQTRNVKVDIGTLVDVATRRRDTLRRLEEVRAEKNKLAKQKPTPEIIEASKNLSGSLATLEFEVASLQEQENTLLYQIPNLNAADTAINTDPDALVVVKEVGERTVFDFEPQDHQQIGECLGLIDTAAGAKVSGSRFWYLKGDLVLLQLSLMHLVLRKAREAGYVPMIPPQLVQEHAMWGTGFLPTGESELYRVNPDTDDLYLVGTSEVPLVSYHADEILPLSDERPAIRYIGYSSCFRREAGASGKDTRGILRGHQFDKLEIVTFCRPEDAAAEHERILAFEESVLQDLEIPYHVLNIVSGDLGYPAAKKYDIEAWVPTQQTYREVTSTSNCTDYQSRRLQIRYKDTEGKNKLAYTLNGTAAAMSRLLLTIIENYQTKDGRIRVPRALRDLGLLGEYIG